MCKWGSINVRVGVIEPLPSCDANRGLTPKWDNCGTCEPTFRAFWLPH